MDMEIITEVMQVSAPVGIIIFGMWFLVAKLWPLFEIERTFTREHKVRRQQKEHEADMAQADATRQMAGALANLSQSIVDCPLKAPVFD